MYLMFFFRKNYRFWMKNAGQRLNEQKFIFRPQDSPDKTNKDGERWFQRMDLYAMHFNHNF